MRITRVTVQNLTAFFVISSIAWAAVPRAAQGNTRVGNGGDSLGQLLESVRVKIIGVVGAIARDVRVDPITVRTNVEGACTKIAALNAEQTETCADFIIETASDILTLNDPNSSKGKVIFEWATPDECPLQVLEDGVLRPVEAFTSLGSDGPITFSWQCIREIARAPSHTMPTSGGPRGLIQLVYHEFGHKVPFRADFIGDAEPNIGGFTGRKLHDTVGAAIAELAAQTGALSADFQVRDSFSCDFESAFNLPQTNRSIERMRRFNLDGDKTRYLAGFGFDALGSDAPLAGLRFGPDNARRSLIIKIVESDGCIDTLAARTRRYTLIKIVQEAGGLPVSHVLPGINPLCEQNPAPIVLALPDGSGSVSCRYESTIIE